MSAEKPGKTGKSANPEMEAQRLVDLLGDIPTMPAVATKVLKVASSEDATVADVTRLIASDQGLASKVLSTCNSAYYGLPQRVKTLSRAVALLGFKSVRNLVLVHSLPWKRASTPAFADQMIFDHAAATAVCARLIGALTGACDAEEALLGGLMHDTGRLAFNLVFPEEYEPVLKAFYNREGSSVDLERKAFGIDHTRVGEQVMRKWSFPDDLVHVAKAHHDPPDQHNPLTLVVCAANELSHLLGRGIKAPYEPPEELPAGLDRLGFGAKDLESLEERAQQAMEQSRDIFSI